jgi:hypothetical protein
MASPWGLNIAFDPARFSHLRVVPRPHKLDSTPIQPEISVIQAVSSSPTFRNFHRSEFSIFYGIPFYCLNLFKSMIVSPSKTLVHHSTASILIFNPLDSREDYGILLHAVLGL